MCFDLYLSSYYFDSSRFIDFFEILMGFTDDWFVMKIQIVNMKQIFAY